MSDKEESKKLYECPQCEYKYIDARGLRFHMKQHLKIHGCTYCNLTFIYPESLKKHMLKHSGGTPYVCKFCKNKFAQHIELKRHVINVHRKEKTLPCPICKKSENSGGKDETTPGKVHACELCRCRFRDSKSLKAHERVHYRERPFGCDVCGGRFIQRTDLIVHMRYHTGERPYACDMCDCKFVKEYHLKTHLRTTHCDKRPFTCDQCESNFKTTRGLRLHVERIHTGKTIYLDKPEQVRPARLKKDKTEKVGQARLKKDTIRKTREEKINQADSQIIKKVKVIMIYACVTCKARFRELSKLKTHMRSHIVVKANVIDWAERKPTRFELD